MEQEIHTPHTNNEKGKDQKCGSREIKLGLSMGKRRNEIGGKGRAVDRKKYYSRRFGHGQRRQAPNDGVSTTRYGPLGPFPSISLMLFPILIHKWAYYGPAGPPPLSSYPTKLVNFFYLPCFCYLAPPLHILTSFPFSFGII